eukprot:GHVU01035160.1.p1 GENE.GHVU01035160.1~~GHVU01035160.1.p1  ORF type:complete len:355 (+),score=65.60 GHVU01035160.1:703-1767(+)
MVDEVERPRFTLVYTYHPLLLDSQASLPFFRRLADLFRRHSVPVGVIALDATSWPRPRMAPSRAADADASSVSTGTATSAAPAREDCGPPGGSPGSRPKSGPSVGGVQLLVPFGIRDGEPAILDVLQQQPDPSAGAGDGGGGGGKGGWRFAGDTTFPLSGPKMTEDICAAVAAFLPVPIEVLSELQAEEGKLERLRDCLFALNFLDARPAGGAGLRGSGWRRRLLRALGGRRQSGDTVATRQDDVRDDDNETGNGKGRDVVAAADEYMRRINAAPGAIAARSAGGAGGGGGGMNEGIRVRADDANPADEAKREMFVSALRGDDLDVVLEKCEERAWSVMGVGATRDSPPPTTDG